MKTTTIIALVGGLAYLGFRAKAAAEEVARAAVAPLPPPPPANSGPVVNGLSFYQLEGLGGFGSKLKKGIKKVAKSKVAKVVTKIDPVAATVHQVKQTVDDPSRLKKLDPMNRLTKLPGASKLPLVNRVSRSGKPKKETPEVGQPVVYQDVNGAIITEAQYNAIVQARSTGTPVAIGGKWALPEGYITSVDPNVLIRDASVTWRNTGETFLGYGIFKYDNAEQYKGIQINPIGRSMPQQTPVFSSAAGVKKYVASRRPEVKPWAAATSNARDEDLVVTASSSDDYSEGPATTHTASSSGAPGLPGGITTELTTPAAEEAAPDMPAPASNTGKLLVGTALAAGAAYLAFG